MQRVFLTGRSMLSNVVDISHGSMIASLRFRNSALFLFDFEAAFPSVARKFLWATLAHLGVPHHFIIQAVKKMDDNNMHTIRAGAYGF